MYISIMLSEICSISSCSIFQLLCSTFFCSITFLLEDLDATESLYHQGYYVDIRSMIYPQEFGTHQLY